MEVTTVVFFNSGDIQLKILTAIYSALFRLNMSPNCVHLSVQSSQYLYTVHVTIHEGRGY